MVIRSTPLATPLIEAVYREVLRVGAYPLLLLDLEECEEILLREGNAEQLTRMPSVLDAVVEHIDAQLIIGAKGNTRGLSGIEPERMAKRREGQRRLMRILSKREQAGEYRRCSALFPTSAYAQDADMSLRDFDEYVGAALGYGV